MEAQVHFDCLYKGIDVASSRSARLLGGNRTVAEVILHLACPCIKLLAQAMCAFLSWLRATSCLQRLSVCMQPLEFTAGRSVSASDADKDVDRAGGLFSGQSGPKPPPVLGKAVIGMRKGGKVQSSAHWSIPRALLL